jgi:hypothetical protein
VILIASVSEFAHHRCVVASFGDPPAASAQPARGGPANLRKTSAPTLDGHLGVCLTIQAQLRQDRLGDDYALRVSDPPNAYVYGLHGDNNVGTAE